MAKTFDDAVKLGRTQFAQPFNEAYEVTNRSRRVKVVLDDYCVHYCRFEATGHGQWEQVGRKEFEDAGKRRCIENALKWVNGR